MKKTPVDLQKRFPIYLRVPNVLSLRLSTERLDSAKIARRWLTLGMSTLQKRSRKTMRVPKCLDGHAEIVAGLAFPQNTFDLLDFEPDNFPQGSKMTLRQRPNCPGLHLVASCTKIPMLSPHREPTVLTLVGKSPYDQLFAGIEVVHSCDTSPIRIFKFVFLNLSLKSFRLFCTFRQSD